MLEKYEIKKRVGRVVQALEAVLADSTELDMYVLWTSTAFNSNVGFRVHRFAYANIASLASSIIYADQQPDPSEAGLFDSAPKPRARNYRLLSDNHTFVFSHLHAVLKYQAERITSFSGNLNLVLERTR